MFQHVGFALYLAVGDFHHAVKMRENLVHYLLERAVNYFLHALEALNLVVLEARTFLYHVGYAIQPLVGLGGNGYAVLHPIRRLFHAQLFHAADVVRVIINGKVHVVAVKALHQHALLVEVGKADGTHDFVHAELLRPCLDRLEQRFRHREVVDYVIARKTQLLYVLLCVVSLVMYSRDSARDFAAVVVAKKHFALGVTVRVVYFGVEFVVLVGNKLRHRVGVALI